MAAHRVNLINKDNTRCVRPRLLEQVPDSTGSYPDEHFDEVGSGDGVEGDGGFAGYGFGEEGLAGSGGTAEEGAFGDLSSCERAYVLV